MGGVLQRPRQSVSKYEILMGMVGAHGNQGKIDGASEGLVLGFQIGRRLTDWDIVNELPSQSPGLRIGVTR